MRECSEIALRHYANMGEVMVKDDKSPLTKADLEIDAFLHEQLEKTFPNIPIVTEERAQSHDLDVTSGNFILVDPIDGTKEFINKRDEFTVNIGLIENFSPTAGIVCAPALDMIYLGTVKNGAEKISLTNGSSEKIQTRKPDNSALAAVASRSHLTSETEAFIDANSISDLKNAGSSLKFCLLANGEADIYPRFGPTMEWDTAAGHAVLVAAGGLVANLDATLFKYAKSEFRNPYFIATAKGVDYTMI